jgi:hypothetical protein
MRFTVEKEAMRLYVAPEELKDAKGERVRQEPILDTLIGIPAAHRESSQFLEAICNAVHQETGYKIGIGSTPANILQFYSTDEGVYNQTARAAVVQFLDRATHPGNFVWDLFYDPEDRSYGLNFAYVGRAGPVHK